MRDGIDDGMRYGTTAVREARPVRAVPRRGRAHGPRPVRPRVTPVAVRPVQPPRPGPAGSPVAGGQRVLLRSVPVLPAKVLRRRRVAATVGVALLAAAVVVLLGLLADVAAAARQGTAGVTGVSLTSGAPSPGQVVATLGG